MVGNFKIFNGICLSSDINEYHVELIVDRRIVAVAIVTMF